jgi:glycosyltransferase involved in cell wall biosynthesis
LLGGTEWSFINMMNSLNFRNTSYDVCIQERGGILEQFLRKDVNIICWEEACSKTYDVAISYAHWISPPHWVDKISAKRKAQWIHVDVEKIKLGAKLEHSWYLVDKYIFVSKKAKKSFEKCYPKLAKKALVVPNFLDNNRVKQEALHHITDMKYYDGILNVVSICRLDENKALDRAIRVHKRLDNEGFSFRWYVVGDGALRPQLEQLISESHLEGKFILLGSRLNPFPYAKRADIFAMFSRSEGFCLTVSEAKILARPIIITNFGGSKEQIQSGTNGLIVENDEEAIYRGLKRMLEDSFLRSSFSQNLQGFEYDNTESLRAVERLLRKKKP